MGVNIGNNNKIKDSIIAENVHGEEKKKNWFERHPLLSSLIITVIAGVILLFSFWEDLVNWIEGVL